MIPSGNLRDRRGREKKKNGRVYIYLFQLHKRGFHFLQEREKKKEEGKSLQFAAAAKKRRGEREKTHIFIHASRKASSCGKEKERGLDRW